MSTTSYMVNKTYVTMYSLHVLILLLLLQSLFKPLHVATTVAYVPCRKQNAGSSVFVKAVCD